jgi:hypothetical protein
MAKDIATPRIVARISQRALRDRLKKAVIRDRDLSLAISRDWSAVDQGQWEKLDQE